VYGLNHNPPIGTSKFKEKQVVNRKKSKIYAIFFLNDTEKHEILKNKLGKLGNNNNERIQKTNETSRTVSIILLKIC